MTALLTLLSLLLTALLARLLILWADLSATFTVGLAQGNDSVSKGLTISADEKVYTGTIPVAAGATVNYAATGDPDNVKAYCILATFSGTLTTTNNPAGTPDVITFVANEPIAWNNKSLLTKHFANGNPWTNWAFHNTDSSDGTVQILIMRDGTP